MNTCPVALLCAASGEEKEIFMKKHTNVTLAPVLADDREQFILDNQEAFKFGALEEFGMRDDHLEDDGEIISRSTIERCLDDPENEAYRIICEGKKVGGLILKIDKRTGHNYLEILFTSPREHSRGIGYAAWLAVEALHPETEIWETCTPYFEKRNIHFYINKCGFSAVEFFCEYNIDPNAPPEERSEGPDEMFRFIKRMK